ncbi:MAG: hypothetical protein JEZ07_19745 [Phycisphaerae bacterium]|nr:hypothetical protein [Phycisphaerae bacterium]
MLTDHRGYNYRWDYENRLVAIDDGTNLVAEFEYDVFGRRIWKDDITAGKTTCYWYNNKWQVLAESDGSTDAFERRYVYGNYIDETLQMSDGTTEHYYAHDHLYSTAAITDATGTVVERYEYEAYGQPTVYTNMTDWDTATPTTANVSAKANPYMFTGRRVDVLDDGGLTLQYSRMRYLDYETGRWLSRDPEEFADGLNVYEYVKSSPALFIDPYGKMSITDALGQLGVKGGASTSKTIVLGPLGPGVVQLTFTGSIEISNCCKKRAEDGEGCCEQSAMICVNGDLELYYAGGKSKRAAANRKKRKPLLVDVLKGHKRKKHADEYPAGYRERDRYVSVGELSDCENGLQDATVNVFIRGSAGAYWGVQGSINYQAYNINDGWDLSWDRLSGEFSGARGIYGVSIEVGGGGHISGCLSL